MMNFRDLVADMDKKIMDAFMLPAATMASTEGLNRPFTIAMLDELMARIAEPSGPVGFVVGHETRARIIQEADLSSCRMNLTGGPDRLFDIPLYLDPEMEPGKVDLYEDADALKRRLLMIESKAQFQRLTQGNPFDQA